MFVDYFDRKTTLVNSDNQMISFTTIFQHVPVEQLKKKVTKNLIYIV